MQKATVVICFSVLSLLIANASADLLPGGGTDPPATEDPGTEPPSLYCPEEVGDMCPPEDGSQPTYFPNPEDCSSFCECSSGLAYLIHCQEGTLWDTENNVCNFEDNVDCGDRPIPPE